MPDTAPDIVSNTIGLLNDIDTIRISEHLHDFDGFPDFDPTVYRDDYSLTDLIGFSVEYNRDTGISAGRHRNPGIHPR
jgi:hypothetical protein